MTRFVVAVGTMPATMRRRSVGNPGRYEGFAVDRALTASANDFTCLQPRREASVAEREQTACKHVGARHHTCQSCRGWVSTCAYCGIEVEASGVGGGSWVPFPHQCRPVQKPPAPSPDLSALEKAFKAGYHCQWIWSERRFIFDPAMRPGAPDLAFQAWLEAAGIPRPEGQ